MTDIVEREQAITSALSSDAEVMQNMQEVEQYIVKNKGMIMGCLSSLPAPVMMLVRSMVKIIIIPLDYVITLPLTKISNVLKDFAKNEPVCPPPPPPSNSSDCTPS